MFERLREDINMVKMRDPAARSTLEIFFCYPGLFAIWFHRISQWLWNHHLLFSGRFISALARFFTGIEIHPGAKVGRRVFIDHGMGVVIGETAVVGSDVLIYQGVVLGGTSLEKKKRHPTIKDGVVIGSGAKIIGNITIGTCSKIGAGSVVLKSIPPGSTCVGIPGRVVQEERKCAIDLDHGKLPDPVAEVINMILKRQDEMEAQIKQMGLTSDVIKTRGLINRKSEIEEIFSEGDGI
jgi:serine O-acetyltransferase